MATSTLGNFSARMNAIADGVEANSDKMVREVVKAVGPVLVYATPILTGRARSNWQGAVNSIPEGTLFYPDPDAPPSPGEGTEMGLRSIEDAAAAYKSGGYVAIVNNVPYIGDLNDGTSQQAPAGFVQTAVVVGISSIANVKLVPQ